MTPPADPHPRQDGKEPGRGTDHAGGPPGSRPVGEVPVGTRGSRILHDLHAAGVVDADLAPWLSESLPAHGPLPP